MKEKLKKIVIILLFVLFILSGLCLIASFSTKTKTTTNKLASAYAPKNAFYKDNSTGHYLSNNLLQNMGSVYNYNVKNNTTNYNTTKIIHLDTIQPNYRNYFGGNRLRISFNVKDLTGYGANCYMYFTTKQCNNRNDVLNQTLHSYDYHAVNIYSFDSSYDFEIYNGILNADNIYVYLIKTSDTNFNGTDIQFSTATAFTYYNTDSQEKINSLKVFDYYGLFVPASYNEDVETAITNSYNQGYGLGEEKGYNKGYLVGYNDGVDTAENGDFNEMITAVADTPFNILYNLFNFEILGVNLWVFITSILSILIVMFIIKKIK